MKDAELTEEKLEEIAVLIRRSGTVLKVAIDELVEIAEAVVRIAGQADLQKEEVASPEPERRFISTKELACRLGISAITVHRLRKEGLPDIRIGHRVVFDYDRVTRWVQTRGNERRVLND